MNIQQLAETVRKAGWVQAAEIMELLASRRNEMSELLPCPFCGSPAKVNTGDLGGGPYYAVVCSDVRWEERGGYNCHGASVEQEWADEAKAAIAWNTRDAISGTFSCPICGKDSPHQHSGDEIRQHRSAALATAAPGDNKRRGLYQKFNVTRTDGSSAPAGKHEGCDYFVLDVTHDPFAAVALRAYADACREEYPHLSDDMRERYALTAAPVNDADIERWFRSHLDGVQFELALSELVGLIAPDLDSGDLLADAKVAGARARNFAETYPDATSTRDEAMLRQSHPEAADNMERAAKLLEGRWHFLPNRRGKRPLGSDAALAAAPVSSDAKDAARYRWLAENHGISICGKYFDCGFGEGATLSGVKDVLDSDIDAAIAKATP